MWLNTEKREQGLRWLLRLGGSVMVLAVLAIFLPSDVMASLHTRLGLGELPRTPLVEYLTRSISALYAIVGGFQLLISTDVRKFQLLVRYVGFVDVLGGAALIGIDLHAGMPSYWVALEGPPVMLYGMLILCLARERPSSAHS